MSSPKKRTHQGSTGQVYSFVKVQIDVLIPMAFPDYKIGTPVGRLPWLGHAGILLINGKNGTARYFEYGRYDAANLGLVRERPVPKVQIQKNGRPTNALLKNVLNQISRSAGHGGRIEAVYIEVRNKYHLALAYCESRRKDNANPKRPEYDLASNNCMTFAKETLEAAGVKTPSMWDPRPNSYIGELRADYPNLDYSAETDTLTLDPLSDP